MTETTREPFELGPMPLGRPMETVDRRFVRAPWRTIFALAKKVEDWPAHLPHYRYVRFRERASDGGGIVEMSADSGNPIPPYRGYYKRHGRGMVGPLGSGRIGSDHRPRVGRTAPAARGNSCSNHRDRSCFHSWNCIANARRPGSGRREGELIVEA